MGGMLLHAEVCVKYLLEDKSFLAAVANLLHLVNEELPQLISDYATCTEGVNCSGPPSYRQSHHQLRCVHKAVSSSARRVPGESVASKVLDTQELCKAT